MNIEEPINASRFKPISGIYAIKNIKTERVYIGQSKLIQSRWASHISDLTRGKHPLALLQEDWEREGADHFVIEILEKVKGRKNLLEAETRKIQQLIDGEKPIYNASLSKWQNQDEKEAKERRETKTRFRVLHSKTKAKGVEDGSQEAGSYQPSKKANEEPKDLRRSGEISGSESITHLEGDQQEIYIKKTGLRTSQEGINRQAKTKGSASESMDEDRRSSKSIEDLEEELSRDYQLEDWYKRNEGGEFISVVNVTNEQWNSDIDALKDVIEAFGNISFDIDYLSWFLRTYMTRDAINELCEQLQYKTPLYAILDDPKHFEALHELAAAEGLTWSEWCRRLADSQ